MGGGGHQYTEFLSVLRHGPESLSGPKDAYFTGVVPCDPFGLKANGKTAERIQG
jgi:hypothetical protein